MSSASPGSGTRRRMKLRSRDCSRLTTSEIRRSCSRLIRSRLAASFIYSCRRLEGTNIVGGGCPLSFRSAPQAGEEPAVCMQRHKSCGDSRLGCPRSEATPSAKSRVDTPVLHQLAVALVIKLLDLKDRHQGVPHFVYALVNARAIVIEAEVCLQLRNDAQQHERGAGDVCREHPEMRILNPGPLFVRHRIGDVEHPRSHQSLKASVSHG